MTMELWMLFWTVVLALAQTGLTTAFAKRQTGSVWSVGPRDTPMPLVGVAGRLERAHRNLLESLPLFAGVVLMAHVTGRADTWTAPSAQIFLAARVLYVPAYVSGIPWLRTGLWWASGLSIVIILTRLTA